MSSDLLPALTSAIAAAPDADAAARQCLEIVAADLTDTYDDLVREAMRSAKSITLDVVIDRLRAAKGE